MSEISLNINLEWNELPTDGSKCEVCKELIIGKMFQLVIFVDYVPSNPKATVCTACYELKKDDT